MRNVLRLLLSIFAVAAIAVAPPANAWAQSEPYKVFDTRPVITQGPYLVATSDTSTTIVWMTDAPSHSKVRYARGAGLGADALSSTAEPQQDGLVPVGLRHVVHVTGLEPGATYSYQIVSTRVVKLKAYWPDKGVSTSSAMLRIHHARSAKADGLVQRGDRHARGRRTHSRAQQGDRLEDDGFLCAHRRCVSLDRR